MLLSYGIFVMSALLTVTYLEGTEMTAIDRRRWEESIDYLKFVVPMDYDRAQHTFAAIKDEMSKLNGALVEKEDFKITVLNGTEESGGRARYCIEFYGTQTHYALLCVPAWFFSHLNRIDWRKETTKVMKTDVRAYCIERAGQQKGRRNTTLFNTKSRKKSHNRDVGGFGLLIGSRKSQSHSVVYQRGDEPTAIECRFQLDKAEEIGCTFEVAIAEGDRQYRPTDLMNHIRVFVAAEIRQAFGYGSVPDVEIAINQAGHRARLIEDAIRTANLDAPEIAKRLDAE